MKEEDIPTVAMRESGGATYQVRRGLILTAGPFRALPIYAPHYWALAQAGLGERDAGGDLTFVVREDDRQEFPELEGIASVWLDIEDGKFVRLLESRS